MLDSRDYQRYEGGGFHHHVVFQLINHDGKRHGTAVQRKATAEMVIMELTKKYPNISAMVSSVLGMNTSRIRRNRPTQRVFPTSSKCGFQLFHGVVRHHIGEEKKWMMLTKIRMAAVRK